MNEYKGIKVGSYKMPAEDSIEIGRVVEKITKEMGEIDVVIANAGICVHANAEVRSNLPLSTLDFVRMMSM